jgi:uracil-DNA glycosylase
VTLMHDLDAEFQSLSGLTDRRYYKIFYSSIHAFPLLVLGLNPGGETDGTDLNASDGFYEHGEHDYVAFRHHGRQYSLAGPMCDLLAATLGTTSEDDLRRVPATNVIFRRSRNASQLNLSLRDAARESAPVLAKVLQAVDPRAILVLGGSAVDQFVAAHCAPGSVTPNTEVSEIRTPNGKSEASIFRSAQAHVTALGREVPLVVVGHPSKYATRTVWPDVVDAVRGEFQRTGIHPFTDPRAHRTKGNDTDDATTPATQVEAQASTEPAAMVVEMPRVTTTPHLVAEDWNPKDLVLGTRQGDIGLLAALSDALGVELEDENAPWPGLRKAVRLSGNRAIYINPTNAEVRATARDVAAWEAAGVGTAKADNERYLRVMLDGSGPGL